jgi:hypothetical protein
MILPPTPDAFYDSAREFAETALEAHRDRRSRRLALDAGTALEHLAKACLATRSAALLTELRSEANFPSLLRLLGIREGKGPRRLRTVGLRDALERAKTFVTSNAPDDELRTLVDMRDGTVHAAQDDQVEERLVVAFVQHADALLADLGRDRAKFWGGQLAVVDALLADASDKIAHHVEVKLAAARASFDRRYGEEPDELLHLVRRLANPQVLENDQAPIECPACESLGIATGAREVEYDHQEDQDGTIYPVAVVRLTVASFACRVCGLQLDSAAELTAARMEAYWEDEGADPLEFEPPFDEDAAYEAWRDQRDARKD